MSSAFWWYVLAGFIVGFSLSTLWEWLYFRIKRVRAIERAVAKQTPARPPADTQWDIVAEETPQTDSVWATSTAQDPGVYLEMEDPDLAAQAADSGGEGLAAATAPVEPEIRPIMVATPQPDAAPRPTTTVNVVNVPPFFQAEVAAPPAPPPPAIAPDPQIVLLTAAIEQLARAMEKSPPGGATGSSAPAAHSAASPAAGANTLHAFSQGAALTSAGPPPEQPSTAAGATPLSPEGRTATAAQTSPSAQAVETETQEQLRTLQENLEERDRQIGALTSILTSLRGSLADALAAKRRLEGTLAERQKVLAGQDAALQQLRMETERMRGEKAAEVAALTAGATIAAEALADKQEAVEAAAARVADLETQLQALAEEKVALAAAAAADQAERTAAIQLQATGYEEQIGQLNGQLETLTAERDVLQGRIDAAEAELKRRTAEAETVRSQLAQAGEESAQEQELRAAEIATLAAGATAAAAALHAKQQEVDAAAEQIMAMEGELQARQTALDEAQRQATARQEELEKVNAKRIALEEELTRRTGAIETLAARADAAQSEIGALRQELQKQAAAQAGQAQERTRRSVEVAALTASAAVAAAELKSRQEALEEAQGQSKALQEELGRVVAEKAGLEQQLQQHAADLEAVAQRLHAAQASLDQTEARREELSALLKERNRALAGAEQKLSRVSRFEGALALAKNLETRHAGKTRAASAAFVAGRQPQLTGEPQTIGDVRGIGPVFQQRLYEAGVGTFWELANLSDEDFRDILKLDDTESKAVDFDKIRLRALRLARESGSLGMLWDVHHVDDLEALPGMGETYERRLYAAGVRTFEALSRLDEEQLATIVRAPKMRTPDFGLWIAEARRLARSSQAAAQEKPANGGNAP